MLSRRGTDAAMSQKYSPQDMRWCLNRAVKSLWGVRHWKQKHMNMRRFDTVAAAVNHPSVKLAFPHSCMEDTAADRWGIISCTVQQRASNGEAEALLVMSGPRSAWSRASGSPRCALSVCCCHNRTFTVWDWRKDKTGYSLLKTRHNGTTHSFLININSSFVLSSFPSTRSDLV